MAGEFQKYIKEQQKLVDDLIAEDNRRKQVEADNAKAKSESRKALMGFLERFVETSIKAGTLNSSQVETYFIEYRKEYGDNALVAKYVSIVVQLITHPLTGVESPTTHRFGNGGLIWRGKEYKTTKALYEAIVELMGFEPLNSQVWFDYLLTEAFEDESKLAAAPFTDSWQTEVILLRKLVDQAKTALELPNIDILQTDDLWVIQNITGGF